MPEVVGELGIVILDDGTTIDVVAAERREAVTRLIPHPHTPMSINDTVESGNLGWFTTNSAVLGLLRTGSPGPIIEGVEIWF